MVKKIRAEEKNKSLKEKLLLLAKQSGTAPETFRALIEAEKHPSTQPTKDLSNCVKNKTIDIGVVSDTCFNSKYQRLDLVHTVYRHFKEMDVAFVLHCGNLVERFITKKQHAENSKEPDYFEMIKALQKWAPKTDLTTYFIGGRNEESYLGKKVSKLLDQKEEEWVTEEIDLIRDIEKSLPQYEFLGLNNARIRVSGKVTIAIASPSSGSRKPYTISYPMQKLIESYGGGEKPTIQLLGYYNKRWEGIHRDVYALMIGTLQNQIPQAYAKQEPSHTLGAVVLRLKFDKDGSLASNGITVRDIPFYE